MADRLTPRSIALGHLIDLYATSEIALETRQHLALLEDASVQQIFLRVGDAVRKRGDRGERRGNEGLRTLNVTHLAHSRVGMLFLITSIAIGRMNDGSSMARKYG